MNTFKKGDRIKTTWGAWMYANRVGVVTRVPRPDRVDVRLDDGTHTFYEPEELIAINDDTVTTEDEAHD